ncbi:uncharacterized protein KLLA0_E01805g [Kluyveromyces lactis]|uniref:L-serine ammonia-lyase n=1 Tax=Kluyveromyces lactis (strain ATCC 8585 / CBS 2359 / DSM 70799 / NBRC 1267 / NRRL Y-1140 / WM37) TaxID=284590 RepID=Q6CPW0_KLULA|nr:uncharacterized protein KLLA0_E01805g [Kluyveromyces lactis]CAG99116.1 KLLA0E01805p [Kluyveromyces lactis]|eukprot:XP_454029.1 uncharacterized protein KLLA0_E01805g [Kluyveromyces lactis]
MDQLTIKTPLLPFREPLNGGPTFLLKYENLQPGGSFKSRGISHLIKTTMDSISDPENELAVYSSSGGNAGLAAARACATLKVPCTVIVPKSTKPRMIKKIESAGAKVVIFGDHWKEADTYLREYVMRQSSYSNTLYVHPFDNPIIWDGHSTMIDEIIEQLAESHTDINDVKGIVCSVGGGGLYNGVVNGLERHGLAGSIPVFAMETDGCDVLSKSLIAGEPVVLDRISSIATSLGSTEICADSFQKAIKFSSKSIVLDDKNVVDTCLRFFDETSILVEPACGASLHTCYRPELLGPLGPDDIVVVILCGGSCNTYDDLKSFH